MKKIILTFWLLLSLTLLHAQGISRNFTRTPMPEVLKYMQQLTRRYTINFIYNELEDYTVSSTVRAKTVPDAIRQAIGFYPISLTVADSVITVECQQREQSKLIGRLVDASGEPLPFANVRLLSTADSAFITGGVTNENGDFVIPCAATEVLAKFTYVGFRTKYLRTAPRHIGTVRLQTETRRLKNVVVEASRLNYRANGYQVNLAGSDLLNSNGVSDLLAFLPAISISEGKVRLMNSEPIIYVDGIRLNSQDELKAISPKRIKEVSVDYLSVGEGAMSKGGVIRITLRRASQNGMEGSLSLKAEKLTYYKNLSNTAPSMSFAANVGKWYVSGWGGYYYVNLLGDERYRYRYAQSGMETETEQKNRSLQRYGNGRLNLSYALSDHSTIALSEYMSNDDIHQKLSGVSKFLGSTDSTMESLLQGPSHDFTQQTTAKFTQQTDDKGSELNLTADYLYRKSHITQRSFTDGTLMNETRSGDITQMARVKPSLTRAVGKGGKLQGGLDFQYIRNKNTLATSQTIADSYTPSAFADYQGRFGKLAVEGGLTLQYSDMKVTAYGQQNSLSDWYLCPQLSLMYMIDPQKQVMAMLNYQRGVDPMPYSLLNDYHEFETSTHYTTGNIRLRLQTNDQLMLQLNLGQHVALSGLMVRQNDVIYFSHGIDSDNPALTYSRPENGDYELLLGANVDFMFQPARWWQTKASVSFFKIKIKAPDLNSNGKPMGKFNWRNNFTFSPSLGGSANFYWETGTQFENYSWHPVGSINVSLWKLLLNRRLRLSLQSTICAKGRRARTVEESYTSCYYNHTKPTSFSLTATWYFSRGKKVKQAAQADQIQTYQSIEEKK